MFKISTSHATQGNKFQSSKRNQLRSPARNRSSLVSKKFTRITTEVITTSIPTTSEKTTISTTVRPRTTRVVRKRISPINRRILTTVEYVPTTLASFTTESTTVTEIKPTVINEDFDEEIASVLPALTSVKPRKPSSNNSITIDHQSDSLAINHIDTTSVNENTPNSFDKILEHQYKIKGLDKDYEDEKTEEDEKLIGVLGSQVKVILHSVSSDMEKTKIECLELGNYPHPLSCDMYISCAKVRGFLEGFIFSCGEGMSFDPLSGVCDWSIKIGCTRNNVKLLKS